MSFFSFLSSLQCHLSPALHWAITLHYNLQEVLLSVNLLYPQTLVSFLTIQG